MSMSETQFRSTLADFIGDELFANRFCDCIMMLRKKNADYSRGEQRDDRIAGFRKIADDTGLSMRQVWNVFFAKHLSALKKFCTGGALESEPIDGRINDLINYLVLLGAIIADEGADVR